MNPLIYAHNQYVICQRGKIPKGRILHCAVPNEFKKHIVKMFIFTKSSPLLNKICCFQIFGKAHEIGSFIQTYYMWSLTLVHYWVYAYLRMSLCVYIYIKTNVSLFHTTTACLSLHLSTCLKWRKIVIPL